MSRIYAASLSDYNSGVLHGAWIDLDDCTDKESILEAIQAMLAESPTAKREGQPAEEYAIHDYDGLPSIFGEWPDLDLLCEYAEAVAKCHDEEAEQALAAYVEYLGGDIKEALAEFEDRYRGTYDSEKDYAEQLSDDIGMLDQVPENLRFYFDFELFASDLFVNDCLSLDVPSGLAVFDRN